MSREAHREGAESMAGVEKEVKKAVGKSTRGKSTGSKKKSGGGKAENKVRKAAKKLT